MQPSYVLLWATSYPKTVAGMCYAMIGNTDMTKTTISNYPIRSQGS